MYAWEHAMQRLMAVPMSCDGAGEYKVLRAALDTSSDVAWIRRACPSLDLVFMGDRLLRASPQSCGLDKSHWSLYDKSEFQAFAGSGANAFAFAPRGIAFDADDLVSVARALAFASACGPDETLFLKASVESSRRGVWTHGRDEFRAPGKLSAVDAFVRHLRSLKEEHGLSTSRFVLQERVATDPSFHESAATIRLYLVWVNSTRRLLCHRKGLVQRQTLDENPNITAPGDAPVEVVRDTLNSVQDGNAKLDELLRNMQRTFQDKTSTTHYPTQPPMDMVYFFAADVVVSPTRCYAIEFNNPDLNYLRHDSVHGVFPIHDIVTMRTTASEFAPKDTSADGSDGSDGYMEMPLLPS